MKRLLWNIRGAMWAYLLVAPGLLAGRAAPAAEYLLPTNGDNVIGRNSTAVATHEDTLFDIARRNGVGYEEIVAANPGVDPWLPGDGTEILLPTRYVLPNAPRTGVVVNLPEHRLYYYPRTKKGEPAVVRTYPISIGKMDWKTPIGVTQIVSKQEKPSWYPPASVLKEHEERGDPLPKVVPPGPDNPLGEYAMRLGIPGGSYLIHGTNKPAGVGMQVTHGCIRLYPEDIAELFPLVPVKTQVQLIDQPNKAGWQRGVLYAERHAPLEGTDFPADVDPGVMSALVTEASAGRPVEIDWSRVQHVFDKATGVPVAVSVPLRTAAR